MKIEGKDYKTIWFENNIVKIIDQTKLPHIFLIKELKTCDDAVNAIKNMEVRGAPLNRSNCSIWFSVINY
jgi:methylthioribose-1-phosphate isomerase